jgi:hypothetical protein
MHLLHFCEKHISSFSEIILASVLHGEEADMFYIRVKLRASLSPDTKQKIFVLFRRGPLLWLHEEAQDGIQYLFVLCV